MGKEYLLILKRNLVNPLVISIAILVMALIFLNELRDAWFISVVITVNVTLAIIQEIRARRALRKLEILTAPKAILLAEGKEIEVGVEAVNDDDIILVTAGDQLPADGEVISTHGLECDESLLTGESRVVPKQTSDIVYAGSTAVAGKATVRVTATGTATRAGTMTAHLKRYEPENTPLQQRIAQTIQILTYTAIVLSVIIIAVYLARDIALVVALKTVTAGTIGVIPEGLLLASTLLLAFGALKLAQQKVLPQKLSAIEAMALLDVLCVDKTGTLTSDTMQFEEAVPFTGTKQQLETAIYVLAQEASSDNATGAAILKGLEGAEMPKVRQVLAFSSERKLSAVVLADNTLLMMGAPEIIQSFAPLSTERQGQVEERVEKGLRVMLVAQAHNFHGDIREIEGQVDATLEAIGIVVVSNALRDQVRETINFLQERGVSVRVISGDNPRTVQAVAQAAGIHDTDTVITGPELATLPDAEWAERIRTTTIFARVLPEQKQHLIKTLQAKGNFTGMVGDGVNDALALKQANLSVAMFAGAAATRRVADIILLDNSFTSLPTGMRLGNRIMQAIELIASLFFHKIIYNLLLLFATLILHMPYPFLPRHVTFMNIFLVTMPSVLWTLFPPETRERVDPKQFWRNTAFSILPIAVLSTVGIFLTYTWLLATITGSQTFIAQQAQTITALIATVFGVAVVFVVPHMLAIPIGKNIARMRIGYGIGVIVVAVTVFAIEPLRSFLDFTAPEIRYMVLPLLFAAGIVCTQVLIARVIGRRLRPKS